MSINAQVEGEHGSIVTMYYAFSKGATMGMIPEGNVPRMRTNPGKWDKWMQNQLPAGFSPDLITALDDNVLSGGDKISKGSNATKAPFTNRELPFKLSVFIPTLPLSVILNFLSASALTTNLKLPIVVPIPTELADNSPNS